MAKMGRPSKLTPEISKKICEAIQAGNYIETAAAYAGINKTTLYDWLKRGAREMERVNASKTAKVKKSEAPYVDFSNAIEKAFAQSEVRDVTIIGQAAKKNWQAAAWRLERRFPTRWGRKDQMEAKFEHTGDNGGPIQHEQTINLENLSDEELNFLGSIIQKQKPLQ